MRVVIRGGGATVTFVAVHFFAFWMGRALLHAAAVPVWLVSMVAFVLAIASAAYVWRASASAPAGLATYVLAGALILGSAGFVGGFFGPIIFDPGANQGPLLGIFITGPIGFLLGAVAGGVYWYRRRERLTARSPD